MNGKKKAAVAVSLALLAAVLPYSEAMVNAQSSTRQQIEQTENEKRNLENRLNETNDNLEDLKQTNTTLKGELNNLNSQLEKVSDNLAEIEGRMRDKEDEIENTRQALEEAREQEAQQYEYMVKRIREMYEVSGSVSYIDALLGAGSISEFVSTADYLEMIEAYDQRKLREFKESCELIERQEAWLQNAYKELEELREAAETEKNKVSGLISSTSNSIASYAGKISEEEKRARETEEEIRKREEDLVYLKKKLADEIAMSKKAANSTWRDISEVEFAESDRYLLANLIYCEAGAEPYDGKVAVGSVVINRVLSSVYPDTVVGVIYQNKQFSPVASGRLALALTEGRANADCYKAADEAMSGVTNVGNCVYFRTPIEGLTGISIGGHIFY